MRRYSQQVQNTNTESTQSVPVEVAKDEQQHVDAAEEAESRRERKKKEQQEIMAILEEEGVLDEMEGKQVRHETGCNVFYILKQFDYE
jgi:rubrerythrin